MPRIHFIHLQGIYNLLMLNVKGIRAFSVDKWTYHLLPVRVLTCSLNLFPVGNMYRRFNGS